MSSYTVTDMVRLLSSWLANICNIDDTGFFCSAEVGFGASVIESFGDLVFWFFMDRIAIIGGGAAGMMCAATLVESGYS